MGLVDKMKDALGMDDATDKAKKAAGKTKDATNAAKDQAGNMGGTAKDQAGGMGAKAKNLVDKGGDKIDNATGGKAAGQVDKAQDAAKDKIDKIPGM